MRALVFLLCCVVTACGRGGSSPPLPAADLAAPITTLAQAGCGACHALGGRLAEACGRPTAPSLAVTARRFVADASRASRCSGGGAAPSADLAAWLRSVVHEAPELASAPVSSASIERGERHVKELGCAACHASFDGVERTVDHTGLAAFLVDPSTRWPGLAHPQLSAEEAGAAAAWLLRAQLVESAPAPGFAFECYEVNKVEDDVPDLAGLEPSARGITDRVDVHVATRARNFVLRYRAAIDVPADGEWTFTVGCDDGGWLWIDDVLLVENGGQKPHKLVSGKVTLKAGQHDLRLDYTQAAGGKSLELLWQGPGVERQPLPLANAVAVGAALVPPTRGDAPAADAVARGRAEAEARRCSACHGAGSDATPPASVKPWAQLTGKACTAAGVPPTARPDADLAAALADPAVRLEVALATDGCLSCHRRDGKGGMSAEAAALLVEVEDLGDEGRLPPDLTAVGRRLRPEWVERVVRDGHAVRDYVRARMPAYGADTARRYAELFTAVDAAGLVDEEPAFSAEAVEQGRKLVGAGGRNCITCHRVQGHASLGPQGMDLAIQWQRLRPEWFREWLLHPTTLRPGTRMPTLWMGGGEADQAEAAAIRVWSSLGSAAPLPSGIAVDTSSYVLEPVDRPILHGAFLKDVSARCLAVGTPARTHYAFDLATARLVWAWHGSFLDARGTWHARAGKLLEPLGGDWQLVEDFSVAQGERRLVGQRRTADGYPVLRVAAGDAAYEDLIRSRIAAGGGELVRTIRCTKGSLQLSFPANSPVSATVGGEPAGDRSLAAGETLEVVYRW